MKLTLKQAVGATLIVTSILALIIVVIGLVGGRNPGQSAIQKVITTKVVDGKEVTTTTDPTTGQQVDMTTAVPAPPASPGSGSSGSPTSTPGSSSGSSVKPTVDFTASPAILTVGGISTLTWTSTGAIGCTASGDWSGVKNTFGSQSTGVLVSAKTYTYVLSCTNAIGTTASTVTVMTVTAGSPTPVPVAPVVTFSANPGTVSSGGSSSLGWSINGNASSTVTCAASGAWSGSKATSGSVSVTPASSATYTLTCFNSVGSSAKSLTVTVNASPTYCSGRTPCYGASDLAAHSSASNCWGYNLDRVINLTAYSPNHPAGGNLTSGTCTKNLAGYLNGSSSISGIGSHNHTSTTKSNAGQISSYLVGYYDSSKP